MYEKFKSMYPSFSKGEAALWAASVTLIVVSFFIFGAKSILTLAASLIGVTALIFNAKGNPAGQFLMIVFSILYGIISYSYAYYGEMITYLGMTAPMQVNRLTGKETVFMAALTAVVTVVFYFLLAAFHTANLLLSTISVTTSFLAVYLTFRRSAYFAIAYAANDIVLIFLWMLAALSDLSYVSVIICFVTFLANDIYGFINWLRIQKRQESSTKA